MGAPIRVRDGQQVIWKKVRDYSPDHTELMTEDELDSTAVFHEPGTDVSLQLFEVKYLPNVPLPVHAHDEDEIIYVVGGSMKLGARELGPGSSVFVGKNTLYSFAAGAQGLRMLNFRPRKDMSFHTAKEFRTAKARPPAEAK